MKELETTGWNDSIKIPTDYEKVKKLIKVCKEIMGELARYFTQPHGYMVLFRSKIFPPG